MDVSVVATAPSDGSQMVNGNMTTTVLYSHLIPSRSTMNRGQDKAVKSIGKVIMDHTLDMLDH